MDRVHATAIVLSTNFVAWALPANHSRFQVTCPFIIFVGRTLATEVAVFFKNNSRLQHKRSSETYIGFSDDLFASIIFVDRVHATAIVLSTNFVAWALPANHSRFQVTCPFIIFVGRTLATEVAVFFKNNSRLQHKRSSETYIGFSDDLFASIIFVDRVHSTAIVLSTNFVAWALPANR